MPCPALVLSILLLAVVGRAEPLTAHRPGEADPPQVIPPGSLQLEGGFGFERQTEDEDDPDTHTLEVPTLEVRIGVLPRLEFDLVADGYVYEHRLGTSNRSSGSDLEFRTKAFLFDQHELLPATSFRVALSIPTGSDAVTSAGWDPALGVLAHWNLGKRFDLVANLGFSAPTQGANDARRVFQIDPKLSLEASLSPRWIVFLEYLAEIKTRGEEDKHSVNGGVSFLLHDDLQLDLSGGVGLNAAAHDFFVGGGAVWRFTPPWAR